MEHHLKIDNLGPIKHCSLDVSNYMVLTGYQASRAYQRYYLEF